MTQSHQPRLFRKRRIRRYVGHSDVYAWLRAYHTQIVGVIGRSERSWADLAGEAARDGLRGRAGASLTANAVLRVWQRVCRDVEAEAEAAPPKRRPPCRMSPDWRPQELVAAGTALRFVVPKGANPVSVASGTPALVTPVPVAQRRDITDFATTDPSGSPVPPGHVFYDGEVLPLHAAQELERSAREVAEIDRGK